MRRGFSLVELSIVLVILGLLTGGILAGQSLIRASELRSITTELSRYQTAIYSFRDKFFALPGDMPNATTFWTAIDPDPDTCYLISAVGKPTCNGDNSGLIGNGTVGDGGIGTSEVLRVWQHLAAAGLIEGSYSGASDGLAGFVLGREAPASKIASAGYGVLSGQDIGLPFGAASAYAYTGQNRPMHLLTFGRVGSGVTYTMTDSAIKPEEAWNLDTKMDDGAPGRGKFFGSQTGGTCATTSVASTAQYKLSTSDIECALAMGF